MTIYCEGARCNVLEADDFIASGAINVFEATYSFDTSWKVGAVGFTLNAVFSGSGNTIIVPLGTYDPGTPSKTFTCKIPWEVLDSPGELLVGAYGLITGTPDTILTTNLVFACMIPRGVNEGFSGAASEGVLAAIAAITPVRGTDYWTADDISTMESYIDNYIDTVILGGTS